MELANISENNLLEDIKELINKGNNEIALLKLNTLDKESTEWNYLYSLYLFNKSWFDSALTFLKKAIEGDPPNEEYQETYDAFTQYSETSAISNNPSIKYHHHHHHHHHHHRTFCCIPCDCDCCCCDCDCCDCDCCEIDCCDCG
ncbi:MAG: hypothetical protein ACRC2K_08885 [Clostridium sp.]